jgi:hypothetical protein
MALRLSTKGAMQRVLEDLDTSVKIMAGFNAGMTAGLVAAVPVARRPEDSADLDRGLWTRDDRGRAVWLRAHA